VPISFRRKEGDYVNLAVLRIRDVYYLSWIPDPDFCLSRIPDPKTATKERGGHKYHKIDNYCNFYLGPKKIWVYLQRIIELSTQKIVIKLSKLPMGYGFGIWDAKSEIRKKPISDAGSWGQKGTGSRIGIRNTET
jgi:hypothetical protein